MAHAKGVQRYTVQCRFRCRHCREIIGSEKIRHYAREAPGYTQPTWFFAAMMMLDHLRDCQGLDCADALRARFGADFLNHPDIGAFYAEHGMIERELVLQEELD